VFERFFAAKADRRLAKEVAELTDKVEALDRTVKSLRLEWEESYDKLHHLMARVTKRALTAAREKDDDPQNGPEGQGKENGAAGDVNPILGTHGRLSAMRSRHGLLPR